MLVGSHMRTTMMLVNRQKLIFFLLQHLVSDSCLTSDTSDRHVSIREGWRKWNWCKLWPETCHLRRVCRWAGRQERGSRGTSTGEARGRSSHRDLIHLDEQQKQVSHIKTSVGVTLNVCLFTSCLTWSNLQRLLMKVSVQNELHINRVTQETCFYINYRNIIIYYIN